MTSPPTSAIPPPPRRPVSMRANTSFRGIDSSSQKEIDDSQQPLPKAGTFRHRRPASTTVSGSLRRGATLIPKPNATAQVEEKIKSSNSQNGMNQTQTQEANPARLRRGVTMLQQPKKGNEQTPVINSNDSRLRRGSVRASAIADNPLPRAGTFAYGTETSNLKHNVNHHTNRSASNSQTHVRRASSTDKLGRQQRVCGMCSSCGGGGIRSMPPWAPERMKLMTPNQRMMVEMDLQQKEERGRLEAELRKKRLADSLAIKQRLEKRRSRTNEIEHHVEDNEEEDTVVPTISADDLDLVELKPNIENENRMIIKDEEEEEEEEEDNEKMTSVIELTNEDEKENGGMKMTLEDCNQCDDLEDKVKDLEEQLEVLREVVQMCADNEQTEKHHSTKQEQTHDNAQLQREKRKGKTWMGKIASAYYGSSTSANERSRLKDEVEALRKATDLLFKKMQPS